MRVAFACSIAIAAVLAKASPAHACFESADCTSSTEYFCDRSTSRCTAGVALCTGDDAGDQGGGDDYLTAARLLPLGTWIGGALCGGGATSPLQDEQDWYAIDLPADQTVVADLEHDGLVTATFVYFIGTIRFDRPAGGFVDLPAGRSYLVLQRFTGVGITTATPYRLLVHGIECRGDSECTATAPSCSNFRCVAGATCAGDDMRDDSLGDDSYLLATRVAVSPGTPAVIDSSLCGVAPNFQHGGESDWFVVHVAHGADLDLQVSATGMTPYVTLHGAGGYDIARNYGLADVLAPPQSHLRATYLPDGDYYVRAWLPAPAPTQPYQLRFVTSSPHACTGRADCAAEYETQLYRGDCRAGACEFITPTDGIMDACDAHTNYCGCTYQPFRPHAEASYCSYLGNWCMTYGRCPSNLGVAGVCVGYDPGTNYPHCPSGCGHLGRCEACTSSAECGYGWTCNDRGQCIDLGLPPQDPTADPTDPTAPDDGGGCSATSVGRGWLVLTVLGAFVTLRRRRVRVATNLRRDHEQPVTGAGPVDGDTSTRAGDDAAHRALETASRFPHR